jgi:hypothetical protein
MFLLQTRASGKLAWPTEKERNGILTEESGMRDSGSRMIPCGMNTMLDFISNMLNHLCFSALSTS